MDMMIQVFDVGKPRVMLPPVFIMAFPIFCGQIFLLEQSFVIRILLQKISFTSLNLEDKSRKPRTHWLLKDEPNSQGQLKTNLTFLLDISHKLHTGKKFSDVEWEEIITEDQPDKQLLRLAIILPEFSDWVIKVLIESNSFHLKIVQMN
ncbi:hypothetical protein Tco_0291066 [Tanacetum coccineum]